MPSNTVLELSSPQKLNEHFTIPVDESRWTGAVGEYSTCFDGNGKKIGLTPARERASFRSLSRAMTPITEIGRNLNSTFGIYLLAFDQPSPAYYVGIAASSSKSPEGVLSRILKHRVKLTSSHIGGSCTTHGGVNHTGGWRKFAAKRAIWFSAKGLLDRVDDGRFSCGRFTASGGSGSHKAEAEWFESQITNRGPLMDRILSLLWPGCRTQDIFLLTTGNSSGTRPQSPQIALWDGSALVL